MNLTQRRVVHLVATTLLLLSSLVTASVSFASANASGTHPISDTAIDLHPTSTHDFTLSSSTQAYDIEGYNYYCGNGGTQCAANANGSVRNCLSSGISCSGLSYADAEAYGPPDGSTAGTADAMVVECAQFTASGYTVASVSVYSSAGQSTYQGIEKDLGTIGAKGTVSTESPASETGAEDNYSQPSSISGSVYDPHSGVNGGSDTASVSGTQNTDNNADAINGGESSITIHGEIDTYNTDGVFQSSSTGTISCTAGGTHANDLYDIGVDHPSFEGEMEWVNNAAGVNAWNDVPLGGGAGFSLDLNALDAGLVGTVPLFDIPGVNGFDASLALVYSSYASDASGSVGHGWSLAPADMRLVVGSSSVTLVDPTGATWVFTEPTSCSFTPPPDIDAVLACSGGGYTLIYNASSEVDTFDANGYLTKMANRFGNTIQFSRDSNHPVTSITTTEGQTIGLTYTNGLLSTITEPGGETWTLGQDQNGDLTSMTDPTGAKMQFAYAISGGSPGGEKPTYNQLSTITDADGNATGIGYDDGGQITSVTNAAGKVWSIAPGSITDPNGQTTTYGFDSQNRINSVTYPDGTSAGQTWTSDNHIASETTPSGATTTFTDDSKNNLTQVALPTGAKESWGYTNRSLPYMPTSFTDAQENTTSYGYTSEGLLSTVTDPSSKTQGYTYNTNGTLATATDENGHQTGYSYNGLGLLQQETPPSPLGSTSMTYTTDDQEATVTDGNGKTTTYTYDKDGRVTTVAYADSTSIGYSYDPAGNLLGMTDGASTTSYHYNNLNQLISEVLPNTGAACTDSLSNPASVCYSYDAVGNLLSKIDGSGTVSYTYSPVNQVASVTDPFGTTTVGYDTDHNRNSLAFPNGVTEAMTYNGAGQLLTIAGTTGTQTLTSDSYSYVNSQTSQSTMLRYSDTTLSGETTYSYDGENRLTGTSAGGSYSYDAAGNITSFNGTTLGYNAANELTSAGSTTYSYDGAGNETGNSAGLSLTYNDRNQTDSIDGNSQSYLGQGQTYRTASASTTYQDDLTSNGQEAGTGPSVPSGPLPRPSIVPLGLPTPTNILQPGVEFPPLAGIFGSSASISSLTDSSGTTAFTRLPDGTLIDERIPNGGSTSPYYYLTDGNGSVLALTDSSGTVQDSYAYDPYGNVTSTSGTVPNPFGFDGGIDDAASGLLKFGTRYYDPSVGRWTQTDPLAGNLQDSQSLDRYAFVLGDPANLVDLLGLISECGAIGITADIIAVASADPFVGAVGVGLDIAAGYGWC